MNACTAQGRIYAPTHPNRDVNDCIPHVVFNPTTGAAQFTGTGTFGGSLAVNSGGASITGNSTISGDANITGRMTANQLYVGSGNVGSIPTCTSAQKLQWNGTAWACVTDSIGATAATEVDPKVGGLTNGRWCRTNGGQVICDVNVPVACGTGQKLYWNGSAWGCDTDHQGVTAETDPKVGTLGSGKWCTSNGSQINCTSDAPSGTTTTTSAAPCVDCNSVCGCGGYMMSCYQCQCYNCSGGDDDNGDW